jgi:hypothetical protein
MNIPLRVTFMASDAEHGGEYFEEPHLRFNVGDRVSASIGAPGERKPGTIMLLNYSTGGGTAVDKIVPYQIMLGIPAYEVLGIPAYQVLFDSVGCRPSHVSFGPVCAWKGHARWRRGALPSRPG